MKVQILTQVARGEKLDPQLACHCGTHTTLKQTGKISLNIHHICNFPTIGYDFNLRKTLPTW